MPFQGFTPFSSPAQAGIDPTLLHLKDKIANVLGLGQALPTATSALAANRSQPANIGMPTTQPVVGASGQIVPQVQQAPVAQHLVAPGQLPAYKTDITPTTSIGAGALEGLAGGLQNMQLHHMYKQQMAVQQAQANQANNIAQYQAQHEAMRKNQILSGLSPAMQKTYAYGSPETQQAIEKAQADEEAAQAYAQQQQERKLQESKLGAYGSATGSAQAAHENAPTALGDDVQKILATGTAQDQVKALTALAVNNEFKQQFGVPIGVLNAAQATPEMQNWYKQRTGQDLTDSLSAMGRQAELMSKQAGATEAQINAAAAPALTAQKIKIGDQTIDANEQGITINGAKIQDIPLDRQMKNLEMQSKVLGQTAQGQTIRAALEKQAAETWGAQLGEKTKNADPNNLNDKQYAASWSQDEINNNVAYARQMMNHSPQFASAIKAAAGVSGKMALDDAAIRRALKLPDKGTLVRP